MITIGIDPHKRTHTAAAVNGATGELLGELTVDASDGGHERLVDWANDVAEGRELQFAVEDCRNVSGRLERALLASGERVVRVPPKLMAKVRSSARRHGKSDSIDALAIARAALREPELPEATDDPRLRELRLLVRYREDLVRERTVLSARLRWLLVDLDPALEPTARGLSLEPTRRGLANRLARREQTVQVRICRELVARIGEINRRERELAGEIAALVPPLCPAKLLELPGCGPLTAAKLVAEIGPADRFRSDARLASHAGCAPLEVSSGRVKRHRLSRRGNRQLNLAFYRIALTQARVHPDARAYLERKRAEGKSTSEAFRCLKRHLVRAVWRALRKRREDEISLSQFQRERVLAPEVALT